MVIDIREQINFLKDLIAKKSRHSLSLKLIVAIGILVLTGSSIFWYMIIIRGEQEFLNNSIRHTAAYTAMIEKSIFINMHARQVGTIQDTIEIIGSSENVMNINVYNLEGEVRFSSDRAMVGRKIDIDSSCRLCHTDPSKPEETMTMKDSSMWTIIKGDDGRVLRFLRPIVNKESCYSASCHYHPSDRKILGILETDYSLANIDSTLRRQKIETITFGIIFTFFFCIVLCIILWKILIKPLQLLADGMKRVSEGDLNHRVEIRTKDEMGMLAETFNSMTRELRNARQKLENWAKELEAEVAKKTEEIRRGQEQLIHTEKLASLGRMAAGVAHEINSPLTGIVTFAHLMLKRIPPENKMDREDLEVIIEQAERCSKIIKGLLGFSRAIPAERADIDINDTIRHTLEIIQNQAKFHNVKIKTDLSPDLPLIVGDASQLQQVFMNLLINAADAMNDRGEITIATRLVTEEGREFLEIEFTDTGPGIPEEHMGKLFEPFFTTKPVGKGTGLGLAVSHGIVRKHGGHIKVKSAPGKGTSFFIRLPLVTGDSAPDPA
ncbi:MAG: HAMP domain-containing protein [Nitrospirae bacterium]|nr:HAMP domain-containing protein [Nitrospirota bacterium]